MASLWYGVQSSECLRGSVKSHAIDTVASTQMKSHTTRWNATIAGRVGAGALAVPRSASAMTTSATAIATTTTAAPGRSGRWMTMLFSSPA